MTHSNRSAESIAAKAEPAGPRHSEGCAKSGAGPGAKPTFRLVGRRGRSAGLAGPRPHSWGRATR